VRSRAETLAKRLYPQSGSSRAGAFGASRNPRGVAAAIVLLAYREFVRDNLQQERMIKVNDFSAALRRAGRSTLDPSLLRFPLISLCAVDPAVIP